MLVEQRVDRHRRTGALVPEVPRRRLERHRIADRGAKERGLVLGHARIDRALHGRSLPT
jgi:hypothetical protein